ncbi:hypothetical protein PTKIN_Ptkin05aG0121700 [Pterospermum kingtungense]
MNSSPSPLDSLKTLTAIRPLSKESSISTIILNTLSFTRWQQREARALQGETSYWRSSRRHCITSVGFHSWYRFSLSHSYGPCGLVISHLPFGPTAYFGLLNVVTRHAIRDKKAIGTVPEA